MSFADKPHFLTEAAATEPASGHSAIRAIRETKGYSVQDLSVTCGLATEEIADIENGKDTDPTKLRRIASALRLPEDAFTLA